MLTPPRLSPEALQRLLRDEIPATIAGYRRAAAVDLAAAVLGDARDVLEVRQAFALARRRAPDHPPGPNAVRAALDERRARADGTPDSRNAARATPRFADAERWLAANPWATPEVERELDALTGSWPAELREERERLRSVARLLVYHRHLTAAAEGRLAHAVP